MESEYSIVSTTVNSKEDEQKIISALLDAKLAACIQVSPITSHYTWEGKLTTENERTLLIKSKTTDFIEIERTIKEKHSYKIPEIIRIPIAEGSLEYLGWIDEVTR